MGSNILGSIYTTTISAEKYIIITSQNIELSGNVIISNGLLNTNSLIPNVPNSASLGSTGNNWSNAYINDVSINNNLQVTGNVYISGNLEASNIYTKSQFDNSYANVYTIDHIDNSFQNVYTIDEFDNSFQNVYTRDYFDQSFANVYTISHIDTSFQNVYTIGEFDNSYANVYTSDHIDNSFQNVYNIEYIDNSFQNVYTRGHIDQSFANVYTRIYIDQSFANVYTRGVIDTSFANIYTRIHVDNSFVTKRVVELSLNALPASGGGSSSSIVLTSISNDLVPLTTNTYSLGSTTKFWNNAYINNLRASNRVYQDINSGPLYEINSTVQTWEWHRTNALSLGKSLATILSVEQNEKVKNLLAGSAAFIGGKRTTNSATAGGKTSADWQWINGDIWNYTNFAGGEPNNIAQQYIQIYANGTWDDVGAVSMRAVYMSYGGNDISWTAVNGYYGLAKDAYPGLNPLSSGVKAVQTWNVISSPLGSNFDFYRNCWSPELRIFVFIYGSSIAISSNGTSWSLIANNLPNTDSYWTNICWSPQLKIFLACASNHDTTKVSLMRSSNGVIWSDSTFTHSPASQATAHAWQDVCWSPELGIFVAVGMSRTGHPTNLQAAYIASSSDGINWQPLYLGYTIELRAVCWSPQLRIFVAVGNTVILYSRNGITWIDPGVNVNYLYRRYNNICWSPELGIFVVCDETQYIPLNYSRNGINWLSANIPTSLIHIYPICIVWSPQLGIFFVTCNDNFQLISKDGINWEAIAISSMVGSPVNWFSWSPELGIFCGGSGYNVLISSLKGRPPTSYNVFDNSATVVSGGTTGTGGTITTSGSFTIHSFTTVGTSAFVPAFNGSVEVLIVGGGGGGGSNLGGGGGGGGVIWIPATNVISGTSYNVVVGDGGNSNTNGQNSTAFGATAAGGGKGGVYEGVEDGTAGGSGGGAGANNGRLNQGGASSGNSLGPNSGFIYGNIGGKMITTRSGDQTRAAGGGGANAPGADTDTQIIGNTGQYGSGSGGEGIVNPILGPSYYWGGGGGGASWGQTGTQTGGWGGKGGGGGGAANSFGGTGGGSALNNGSTGSDGFGSTGGAGGNNTGGGGGGGNWSNGIGGKGGSGIVVIRYIASSSVNVSTIDETGKWTFSNMAVTTLNVTGTFTNTSDDRLKHNEVVIANGLEIIDKLNPKFYQKTQTLLDSSYNGDLSGQAWTYEAGLIAQELLQIPELSFAVCGGDYYQKSYILKNQSNDISTNYYDISRNYYDISSNYINRANYYDTSANYDISYNLIAQPYSLNYTSIYVYVFAAIKELHAKVKAQETAIYNRQAIINNCITRIETLEQRNQV